MVEDGYLQLECELDRFVEKPSARDAAAYYESGEYLWNAGLFMVRPSVWLDAMRACRPDILEACESAVAKGARGRTRRGGQAASRAARECGRGRTDGESHEIATGEHGRYRSPFAARNAQGRLS